MLLLPTKVTAPQASLRFGRLQLTSFQVPSIVTVGAEHVERVRDEVVAGGSKHDVDKADRATWIELARQPDQRLKVFTRACLRRGWFISDRPQDDTSLVLVAYYNLKFADGLSVNFADLIVTVIRGPLGSNDAPKEAGGYCEVQEAIQPISTGAILPLQRDILALSKHRVKHVLRMEYGAAQIILLQHIQALKIRRDGLS